MRNETWMRGAACSRVVALGCVALIVALAGCGVTPGTQVGVSGDSTATATATAPTTSSATTTASASTGCPGPEESVSWPTPPTAVVTQPQGTTSVKVGQTIELQLAMGHRWSLATSALNGTFTLDQPAGYADTQTQTCDWHFTAKQAGSQDLTVVIGPICQPHMECPQNVIASDMTIAATA